MVSPRRICNLAAKAARHLHPYVAPRGPHFTNSPSTTACFEAPVQSDRRCLAEHNFSSADTQSGGHNTVICTPVRPFFICTAARIHIPGARFQQQFDHVGQHLGIGVVDHRLDDCDRLLDVRRSQSAHPPGRRSKSLASTRRIASARTGALSPLQRIARQRLVVHHPASAAPKRLSASTAPSAALPHTPAHRPAEPASPERNRQRSMLALHRSAPYVQGRSEPTVYAQDFRAHR